MEIFRIWASDDDQYLVPRGGEGLPPPLRRPFSVELIDRDDGRPLLATDFPWLAGHIPVYSARAVDSLHDTLARHGELFRLDGVGDEMYGLEVHVRLDALDEERSEIVRFPSTGRIMDVTKHVFQPDAVAEWLMFHIPQLGDASWTYVTSDYVQEVARSGLVGAHFESLWKG